MMSPRDITSRVFIFDPSIEEMAFFSEAICTSILSCNAACKAFFICAVVCAIVWIIRYEMEGRGELDIGFKRPRLK